MSDPVSVPQQYPRGWYPDPTTPGRDRWWDGQQRTRFTARTVDPAKAHFGVPYAHSMRIGPNRILIAARVLVLVALLIAIFALFSIVTLVNGGSMLEFTVVVVVGVVACLATSAIGFVGLRRAPRLGGRGTAIWSIISGGTSLLLLGLPLLYVLFYRP